MFCHSIALTCVVWNLILVVSQEGNIKGWPKSRIGQNRGLAKIKGWAKARVGQNQGLAKITPSGTPHVVIVVVGGIGDHR